MTTKLKALVEEIREEIDDFNQNEVSAYTMLKKCNKALRRISKRLIKTKALILTKRAGLTPVNGAAQLPDDFQNLVLVTNETTINADTPAKPVLTVSTGNSRADLTWTNAASAASYFIYQKNPLGMYDFLGETTDTSFTVSGLTNGNTYTFAIAAVNENGSSASNEAEATLELLYYPLTKTIDFTDGEFYNAQKDGSKLIPLKLI